MLAVLGATAPLLQAPETADAQSPIIYVSPTSTDVGGIVSVHGSGFAPEADLSVAICGDAGLEGAQGCDLRGQATLLTDQTGYFAVELTVGTPPASCPCVVEVDSPSASLRTAIAIAGVPVEPTRPAAVALGTDLRITNAHMAGGGGWQSWFGWSTRRFLVVTVSNQGGGPAAAPTMTLEQSSWTSAKQTVSTPELGPIPANEKRVYRVPVHLGFTLGEYTFRGTVYSVTDSASFRTTAFVVPWALVIIAAAILQGILLLLRNRLRARLTRDDGTPGRPPEDPVEPDLVDLTEVPLTPPPGSWTTTERLFFSVAERALSCMVERLACPSVGLVRTRLVVWDAYTCAPWEALHDDTTWASLLGSHFDPDSVVHESPGLQLDTSFSPDGPAVSLGQRLAARHGQVRGHITSGGETLLIDSFALASMAWTAAPDNWQHDEERTLSYGIAEGTCFCFTQPDSTGWLTKDGITARLVQVERSVDDRLGPYATRLTVRLRDERGRTIEATGRTVNGFATRIGDDQLGLSCSTDWDIEGVTAVGEDREWMDVETWRSLRRWVDDRVLES